MKRVESGAEISLRGILEDGDAVCVLCGHPAELFGIGLDHELRVRGESYGLVCAECVNADPSTILPRMETTAQALRGFSDRMDRIRMKIKRDGHSIRIDDDG